MYLRNIVVKENKYLKYYDFYKKLGYSDEQSLVLTLYPYGNDYKRSAFNFYRNLYKNLEKKDKTFCEYLSEKIVEVYENKKKIDYSDVLKDGKEYRDGLKKREAEEGTWATMDACLSFNSVSGCSMGSPMRSGRASFSVGKVGFSALNNVPQNVNNCFLAEELELCEEEVIENFGTDSYDSIEEKGFQNTLTNPTSTFRMTSNTAAFGILRNNGSRGITSSMVRIEEILNSFKYNLTKPTNRVFNINTELCNKPNSKNKLLFVGVQGKDTKPEKQNITILLDTSGSMSSHNKETQMAIMTILSQLNDGDILSLVTYSSTDKTIFENYKIDKKTSFDFVIDKLCDITITGCTYGSKGIETAYELTNRTYIKDGINRVMLMTDGDLNFGITSKDGLKELILDRKDNGIFLSVLGVGLYNYKDDTLEVLAKNGNGNYCTIDCIEDVEENILDRYNSLVFTIAKDVKAQVEFNPKFVKEYRLIGYENRSLNHNDFKNDKVISEPFGCGGYGIALYELVMQDEEIKSDLKFQKPLFVDSENLCSVSVRYKNPLEDVSQELSVNVKNKEGKLSDNLLLAYTIFIICEKLRDSSFVDAKDEKVIKDLIPISELKGLYLKNKKHFDFLISLVM